MNKILGNLKNAITGAYHAFDFEKVGQWSTGNSVAVALQDVLASEDLAVHFCLACLSCEVSWLIFLYSNRENLVLWARSEFSGFAI